MKIKYLQSRLTRLANVAASLLGFSLAVVVIGLPTPALASCGSLDTAKGVVYQSVDVPASATYTVWSRIMAPDTANNSYYLQIEDSSYCGIAVGDSPNIPANSWTWVDYKSGQDSNKNMMYLGAGNHTVSMIGKEQGVKLDRLLFLQDGCIPTGTGDNCAPPSDTTSPTTSITSPDPFTFRPGDVNGDGGIDVFDVSTILFNFGRSGKNRVQGDLNGDGVVNVFDVSLLLYNFGR